MAIYLAKDIEAQELLNDDEFGRKWTELHKKCPWATVFQDFQYLSIWNRNFGDVCETFIVYEIDENNDLIGLFPFSKCRATNKLFITGDYHSEYQTWLATVDNGNEFAEKAFDLLAQEFPTQRFQMMFLAPGTPLEWLKGKWGNQIKLQKAVRPLVKLDGENTAAKSLRKKGNKTRIRQLKKQGELKFEEITSADEFAGSFDEIESYSHLRVSGIHNVQFGLDKRRKQFHIDLIKETDIVYPTILRVGDKIASSQVCFRNNDEMLLCITSMSPFFAKQSPSKIHLLMLGNELNQTNKYKNFDLSPGKGYKERFANEISETRILTIFFNRSDYLKYNTKCNLLKFGRKHLERLNIKKTRVFGIADKFVHKLRRVKFKTIPQTIIKNIGKKIYENKEARIYSFGVSRIKNLENPNLMRVDSVQDLLKYKPFEGWQDTTSQFHQKVLERFAQGTHSYSCVENNELIHYGWLNEHQDISYVSEVEQSFKLPKKSAVIFDYYTHPKARGRGLYQKSILQGLHDAAKIPDTEQVFIGVVANNRPSRHVIEKLGFKYEGSLFQKTLFGFVKKWQVWEKDSDVKEKEFVLEESYST